MRKITIEKATSERLRELKVEKWSTWECGIETFDWEYSSDEVAYVKEGQVKVRTIEGQDVEFGAGDIVTFPEGLRCTWMVIKPIKKVYTFR